MLSWLSCSSELGREMRGKDSIICRWFQDFNSIKVILQAFVLVLKILHVLETYTALPHTMQHQKKWVAHYQVEVSYIIWATKFPGWYFQQESKREDFICLHFNFWFITRAKICFEGSCWECSADLWKLHATDITLCLAALTALPHSLPSCDYILVIALNFF